MSRFYYNLAEFVRVHDTENANSVIMQELGRILVHDRENFITLLKYSGVPADDSMSDSQLIDMFIQNCQNRKVLISAAFLINQHNKRESFDGQPEISDKGVKRVHTVMYNYFEGYAPQQYSNVGGAWAGALDSVAQLGGKITEAQRAKKSGATDMLMKQKEAKQSLLDSALEQRKLQQQGALKQQAEKDKRTKIIIIAGASVLVLGLGVIGIVMYNRHK